MWRRGAPRHHYRKNIINCPLLIYKSILPDHSLLAFWKMEETEEHLRAMCNLTDEDNRVIERCSADKRRIELLAVRTLLKTTGINQTIHYNDRKPYLDNGYISISHSSNIAAIIFNPDFPVGIDIETISPRIRRIATRAFSESELAAAADDLEKLTVLWNCKECVFKLANDEGIDFRNKIEVALPTNFMLPEICAPMQNIEGKPLGIRASLYREVYFSLSAIKIEGNTAVWGRSL